MGESLMREHDAGDVPVAADDAGSTVHRPWEIYFAGGSMNADPESGDAEDSGGTAGDDLPVDGEVLVGAVAECGENGSAEIREPAGSDALRENAPLAGESVSRFAEAIPEHGKEEQRQHRRGWPNAYGYDPSHWP
jgi:hypothetical protein